MFKLSCVLLAGCHHFLKITFISWNNIWQMDPEPNQTQVQFLCQDSGVWKDRGRHVSLVVSIKSKSPKEAGPRNMYVFKASRVQFVGCYIWEPWD